MGDADFGYGHGVEAHESGGYGVDGYLVGGCEDDVFGVDAHGAGAGSVAGEGAVHDSEESAVDFALDLEEVDEGFVDLGVGPVAVAVEESAEGVFHGAGHLGEDVSLDGGELDDVGA